MTYDEKVAEPVRDALGDRREHHEQKMFGGIGFLLGGNMCCGVHGTDLIVRVSTEYFDAALEDPNARAMDITGRPTRGWLFVSPAGTRTRDSSNGWSSKPSRSRRRCHPRQKGSR